MAGAALAIRPPHVRAAYYANVTYMDAQLGRVLAALDDLGLPDRTVVIYTTDHGENLFNHGMVHKHCFYEQAVAVPLLLRLPALIAGGQRREHLVNLIDLFPTLMDLCALPHPEGLDGSSLLEVLERPETAGRDAVFSEFYEWGKPERMIRTARWKYVHSHEDTPQLYDLRDDPGEHRNLALEPGHQDVIRQLDARVMEGWELPPPDYPAARPDGS